MKKLLITFMLIFAGLASNTQSLYFPPLTGSAWDTVAPADLGWCTDKIPELINYLDEINSKAFILLKDGKIVIEKYFGTFTVDSLWYWASAGKTLTSFMVGIAQQEGYLSISDTSSQYLGTGWTNCPPDKEEKITVRHQLTMTSGLDDGVPDHFCTLDTCLNYLADAGTRWAYHNGPYTLLDGVIQNATGQTLNTYTTTKLKTPTGMTGLFYPSGYNNVFVSKARSMARFGLLILNHGNWNGNQIMTDTAYFNQMVNTSQDINKSYGYLWWLNGKASFMVPGLQYTFPGAFSPNAPDDMFAAMGKNGQFLNVVPSMNLVFVRMGNAPAADDVPFLYNDTIWQKLNDVICTSGVPENLIDVNSVTVIPNPAKDRFQISGMDSDFDFVVYNYSGIPVMSGKNCTGEIELHCGNLISGMYILKVSSKNKFFYKKLIITR